jgi:hypothetical protein
MRLGTQNATFFPSCPFRDLFRDVYARFACSCPILYVLQATDSITGINFFVTTSEPALGPTQCPVQSFDRTFFFWIKRPERKGIYSPAPNTKDQNT